MSTQEAGSPPKRSSRGRDYLVIAIVIGLVVAAAYYQESIPLFFKYRLWDPGAPGRTVAGFLDAVQRGDQGAAEGYLGGGKMRPLLHDGKWTGYQLTSFTGTQEFPTDLLLPEGKPHPSAPAFSFAGGGSAEVRVPNRQGKQISYSLSMFDNEWKVVNITPM